MGANQESFTDKEYEAFAQQLAAARTHAQLFDTIASAPFSYRLQTVILYLGVIECMLINSETDMIERVAISKVELADNLLRHALKDVRSPAIPYTDQHNIIAKAIRSKRMQTTRNWKDTFSPVLSDEDANLQQAGSAIACSVIAPLKCRRVQGALIFDYFQYVGQIGEAQRSFMQHYTRLVSEQLDATEADGRYISEDS